MRLSDNSVPPVFRPRLPSTRRLAMTLALAFSLILAVTALALLPGRVALAQSLTTLVSNTQQGSDTSVTLNRDQFQTFTTGDLDGGYTLAAIDFVSEDAHDDDFTVAIWTTGTVGLPSEDLGDLTAPSSFEAGQLTFTAPANTVLAADTTYAVALKRIGSGRVTLDATTSDSEDSGAASGWSIGNNYRWKQDGGTWVTPSDGAAWRITFRGYQTTTATNNAPVFDPATVSRSVTENVAAGQDVGEPVTATDADSDATLTYSLGGADGDSFEIVRSSGQIRTKPGVTYNHEAKASYSVTVTASDGVASADASVTITVADVDEPLPTPGALSFSVAPNSTSISATWERPDNLGPAMTYELQYRKVGDTTWLNAPDVGTSTSATIEDLVAGDEYELRVRAKNAEGVSDRFFWIHPAPPKLCTPRAGPRWSIEQGAPPSISRSPRRTACKPATTGCRSTGTISRHTFDGGRAATSTA